MKILDKEHLWLGLATSFAGFISNTFYNPEYVLFCAPVELLGLAPGIDRDSVGCYVKGVQQCNKVARFFHTLNARLPNFGYQI